MIQKSAKYIVPAMLALVLLTLFRPVYCTEGEVNYLLIWILLGLPFGIGRMNCWMVPHRMDLSGSLGVFVFDLIIAGLIGGFVAVWYLLEIFMKVTWRLVSILGFHILGGKFE